MNRVFTCGEISMSMTTGTEPARPVHRLSISSSVASFTLEHSHSHPYTTTVVVWKFFCFWRNMICMLYWSWGKRNQKVKFKEIQTWMALRKGLLVSGAVWKLGTMGRSKLKRSGVSSLTLALARSTPAISPAIDTWGNK